MTAVQSRTDWDPGLYLRFERERTRPALDLASRLAQLVGSSIDGAILDLGCGPGNSTAALREVFPRATLEGLDSSVGMIDKARSSGLDAEWIHAYAASFEPKRKYRVVFSNATLQWIPDQASLIAKMDGWLEPEGAMAIQVPGNAGSGLHRALLEAASSPRWSAATADLEGCLYYREPDYYYEAAASLGYEVELWETTYWHVLENRRSLIEWYSSTGMRPWLEALGTEDERSAFKADVLERAAAHYPERADGSVFFPFRRIFFIASKTKDDRGGIQ